MPAPLNPEPNEAKTSAAKPAPATPAVAAKAPAPAPAAPLAAKGPPPSPPISPPVRPPEPPMTVGAYVPPVRPKGLSRRWRLAGMVAATCAYAGLAVFGGFWAIFSPLVFDRQGNLLNPLAWLGFLLMITFWIVCVLGPFGAWVAWSRKQEPLAWAAMAAPAAWGLLMMTVLQFVPK